MNAKVSMQETVDRLQVIAGDLLITNIDHTYTPFSLASFRCKKCNAQFSTTIRKYLIYDHNCTACKPSRYYDNTDGRQQFIDECIETHGLYYDYSKIPDNFKVTDLISIICPKHGDIKVQAFTHKKGAGCVHCRGEKISSKLRKTQGQFIFEARVKYGDVFSYEKVNYINAHTKITITCTKHGDFVKTPDAFLRGSKCNQCSATTNNKPIKQIKRILTKYNILFKTEYTFNDCIGIGGRKLRFDLFIPIYNLCIEYDGPQHKSAAIFGEAAYVTIQQHDIIKNNYCIANNIDLLRIPHTVIHPDVDTLKYIQKLDPIRYMYTWGDYSIDINKIITYIKSYNYKQFCIYGVTRGSLIPMVHISNILNCEYGAVRFQRYDAADTRVVYDLQHKTKNIPIFVIDDLVSTGITMDKVVKFLKFRNKKAQIHPIVLFGEDNTTNIMYVNQHPGQWIIFPWEL